MTPTANCKQGLGYPNGVRVILDTNLWSMIGDEGSVDELNAWVVSEGIELLTPPAILTEMIRVSRQDLLEGWLRALTTGRRTRLASEAELESREVVAEVKRLHPGWMRRWPDTPLVAQFNTFWTRKIWRLAKEDPVRLMLANTELRDSEGDMLEVQRSNQQSFRGSGEDWTSLDAWIELTEHAPADWREGWPDRRVEAWRANAALLFWSELYSEPIRAMFSKDRATYADWIGAFVDLPSMLRNRATFNKFWLEEVDVLNMRRRWLRYAVDVAQSQSARKIRRSNFRDNQLSAYLPDCDVFVTADIGFAEALDLAKSVAPFPLCEIRRLAIKDERDTVLRLSREFAHPSDQ